MRRWKLVGLLESRGGAKINFKHPDESNTPWEPKLDGSLDLTGGMTYAGTVARSEYETIFPPDKDEEEAAKPAPAPKAKPAAKKTTKKPAAKKK